MSPDLKTLSPIAGEDPRAIRDILQRCHGHMSETWLRKTLGFNDEKAREVASVLLQSGYVEGAGPEEAGQTVYKVTGKGRDLMRASAATRIRRTTAKLALDEFMGRVHRVNKNSAYLYSIIKVVVFGGFLRRGERLGDVDVAVDLKPRIPLGETGGKCSNNTRSTRDGILPVLMMKLIGRGARWMSSSRQTRTLPSKNPRTCDSILMSWDR